MIAVVGGTGRLGRLVAGRLVDAGQAVRVVARSAPVERVPGARFVPADLREPASLPAALEGATVVVAAAHGMHPTSGESPAQVDRDGNRNLIDASAAAGAALVLVSVIGAAPGHPLELHRMKWAAEEHLRASSARWTIVRASAFAEMWLELLRASATKGKGPVVFGRGQNPMNFVSVRDVAEAVARAATQDDLRGQVIEVGGPDNPTIDQLARLVRPGTAPRHVPRLALAVMGQAARPVRPGLARLARQSLAMDRMDLRFDAAAARTAHPWLPQTPVRDLVSGPGAG